MHRPLTPRREVPAINVLVFTKGFYSQLEEDNRKYCWASALLYRLHWSLSLFLTTKLIAPLYCTKTQEVNLSWNCLVAPTSKCLRKGIKTQDTEWPIPFLLFNTSYTVHVNTAQTISKSQYQSTCLKARCGRTVIVMARLYKYLYLVSILYFGLA